MTSMVNRASILIVPLWLAAAACQDDDGAVNCVSESGQATVQVVAGAPQSDGSVTVYGTTQFPGDGGSSGELAVRDVYVAGVEVVEGSGSFNFRTWSVSIGHDRLVALAADAGTAALPVVVYLYGGCIEQLPASAEPVVPVVPVEGGTSDAGTDASTDESDGGDASVADANQGLDASVPDTGDGAHD
jgi:hypothetical protein